VKARCEVRLSRNNAGYTMQAIHVDDDDDDSDVCNLSRGSKSMARKMQGRKMRNQIYRTGERRTRKC